MTTPGALTCMDCGQPGPLAPSMTEARAAAKEAGWTRVYRGSGDTYRCPGCRRPRGKVPAPRCPTCGGSGRAAPPAEGGTEQ